MLLLVCLLFLPAAETHAQGESPVCTTNRNSPPLWSYHWPRDSEVKVYFVREMFTPEQRAALIAAMDAWKKAVPASGVKFTYAGEILRTTLCGRCLTVQRSEVYKVDQKHYALFYPVGLDQSGQLFAGWIDLDFATTSPQALQSFMVHELGHSLGLGDCPKCKKIRRS